MPVYIINHYAFDDITKRSLRTILPYKKYIVEDFIDRIETYIEDYFAVVKNGLETSQANETTSKLESVTENINQVLNDLQTLPAEAIPLLKAKASFSGIGYLPEILDHTRANLMRVRDIVYWTTDNIHGEGQEDALYRLRILVANIIKLYVDKFNQIPEIDDDSELIKIIKIVFKEIKIAYSKTLVKNEIDKSLEENLLLKY